MDDDPGKIVRTLSSKEENRPLDDSKKLVIRLSRRNKLMEKATRRHYASNPNVVFVYEEDEILDNPEYWVTIAERANIPIRYDLWNPSDDAFGTLTDQEKKDETVSQESKSLLESLQDRFKAYKQLSKNEEDAYFANIEREYRLQKERVKQAEQNNTVRTQRISRLYDQLKNSKSIHEIGKQPFSNDTVRSEPSNDGETDVVERHQTYDTPHDAEKASDDSIIILSESNGEHTSEALSRQASLNGSNVEIEIVSDSDKYSSGYSSEYDDEKIDDHKGTIYKAPLKDDYRRHGENLAADNRNFRIQDTKQQNSEESDLFEDTGEESDGDDENSEQSSEAEEDKDEENLEDNLDINLDETSEEDSKEELEQDQENDVETMYEQGQQHARDLEEDEEIEEEDDDEKGEDNYSAHSLSDEIFSEDEAHNYVYDENQKETVYHNNQNTVSNKELLRKKDNASHSIYHEFYMQGEGNMLPNNAANYVTLDSDSENFDKNVSDGADHDDNESANNEIHHSDSAEKFNLVNQQQIEMNDMAYAYELAKLSQQYQNDIDMIVNESLKEAVYTSDEDRSVDGEEKYALGSQNFGTTNSKLAADSAYLLAQAEEETLLTNLPKDNVKPNESVANDSEADHTLFSQQLKIRIFTSRHPPSTLNLSPQHQR